MDKSTTWLCSFFSPFPLKNSCSVPSVPCVAAVALQKSVTQDQACMEGGVLTYANYDGKILHHMSSFMRHVPLITCH